MIKWYSVFGMTKLILSAYGLLITKAEMELHAGTFTKDSENKINWRKKTTYPSFLESRETILNRRLASRWADGVIYSELSHGNNSHAPCNICQIFSPGSCASDCCNLLPRASKLLARNHMFLLLLYLRLQEKDGGPSLTMYTDFFVRGRELYYHLSNKVRA